MNDCIFCKIINKELASRIEFEDESVIAFHNIHPVASVHLLIVPKEHVPSFIDITQASQLFAMRAAAKALIEKFKLEKGYKLVFNGGKYQAIPHVHWHLLGGKLEDSDDVLNNT